MVDVYHDHARVHATSSRGTTTVPRLRDRSRTIAIASLSPKGPRTHASRIALTLEAAIPQRHQERDRYPLLLVPSPFRAGSDCPTGSLARSAYTVVYESSGYLVMVPRPVGRVIFDFSSSPCQTKFFLKQLTILRSWIPCLTYSW
jgi:hypothetical protein